MGGQKKFPTRCQIMPAKTENTNLGSINRQYTGQEGIAEQVGEKLVRIVLDNGVVLWGHECEWMPTGQDFKIWVQHPTGVKQRVPINQIPSYPWVIMGDQTEALRAAFRVILG